MKTYAIFPVRKTMFSVDGVATEFTPEDQIGVVSVDGVSLLDLLGAIQYRHCKAVEIDEEKLLSDAGDEVDETEAVKEAVEPEGYSRDFYTTPEDQPEDQPEEEELPEVDSEPSLPSPSTTAPPITDRESIIHQYIADGLDEKIATVLADQKAAPADLREMIAAGYDLTEIEDIGKSRAAAILAVYKPAASAESTEPTDSPE